GLGMRLRARERLRVASPSLTLNLAPNPIPNPNLHLTLAPPITSKSDRARRIPHSCGNDRTYVPATPPLDCLSGPAVLGRRASGRGTKALLPRQGVPRP